MQNENRILLSIVIPHFNSADSLSKLLSTIPDEPQIEVIVVDDHSTKKLEEYLDCRQKYEKGNVRFLKNGLGKKSAGAARNTGIRHAKGKYLLFADADDWFVGDFWSIVQRNIVDGADIVYFAPISQKESGKKSSRHVYYERLVNEYLRNSTYQNELKLKYLYCSPCSKLIRRSVVVKNCIYFDEIQFSNDMLFAAKLGNVVTKVKVSDDTIYCIWEHRGSLTTNKSETAMMMRQKVYCKYYFYLRKTLDIRDFRLLGFTAKEDWRQIKLMISAQWYECQHGVKRKSI